MEELGRGLALEPFIDSIVLFGGALAGGADATRFEQDIAALISGELQGALAISEPGNRYELNEVGTQAKLDGDNYIISGEKIAVSNGGSADRLVVSARTAGQPSDTSGISLFCIDANEDGVSKQAFAMMDGHRAANIRFDDVRVSSASLVGELHHGHALLRDVVERGMLALCAEALGIMDKLQQTTVAYTQTRKQFGKAIGSFQALQHRMVDMFIACEQTRSLLLRAACTGHSAQTTDDEAQRSELNANMRKDIYALKSMVARAGKLVGDEALQLHGGIGMTDELDIGHYVKRLLRINSTLGDEDFALREYAALSLD
ncbi:MAG: pimeloyl-CoA dehydrogenase small subunit [Pseudomonadales bacterium]|nr:pimeloyl-CoA dehydrogenase small subunit [Pseudomonadales bacterium]